MGARCGGIAQLARAFGSYPECRRFKSHCRYQPKTRALALYIYKTRASALHIQQQERKLFTYKNKSSGSYHIRPGGQAVKTPPFHGGNTSSILVRVTTTVRSKERAVCLLEFHKKQRTRTRIEQDMSAAKETVRWTVSVSGCVPQVRKRRCGRSRPGHHDSSLKRAGCFFVFSTDLEKHHTPKGSV